MGYIPNTAADRAAILDAIGIDSFDDLLTEIPAKFIIDGVDIPDGKSEKETYLALDRLASKNRIVSPQRNFLGGGYYYRYIPAAVDHLTSRSEFYTAYTPYQPEISQGTLISIFEFQSYLAELTGMEMSNASLYDGATACAEAIKMAVSINRRKSPNVIVVGAIPPAYKEVVESYNRGYGLELSFEPECFDLSNDTAAVVLMVPDYLGQVNDYSSLIKEAKEKNILVVMGSPNPLAFAIMKSPGEWGADIVFGEAASLGNAPNFGGPALGFITTLKKYVRNMPGRICGETIDKHGNPGFVLTFQTREQHIRREKANSNICSNQGLVALRTTIYLSLLGFEGVTCLAQTIFELTLSFKKKLSKIAGVHVAKGDHFQEFVFTVAPESMDRLQKNLKSKGIEGGIMLGHNDPNQAGHVLVAVNEYMKEADLDVFAAVVKESLS
jgi:glycine dehydrogenase subunit 1